MKKTWGIILIILGVMGIAGGFVNGSVEEMNIFNLIGFFGAAAICFYFGIKLIKKDKIFCKT